MAKAKTAPEPTMTEDEAIALFDAATQGIAELETSRATHTANRRRAVIALKGAGWSMQRIADAVGISKTAVAQVEKSSR